MLIAKAFKSGGSMAIRIPKEFNIKPNDEFYIEKSNGGIMLKNINNKQDRLEKLEKMFANGILSEFLPSENEIKNARLKKYAN